MLAVKKFFRLLYINYVLLKNGLDEIILETNIAGPFRYLLYIMPTRLKKNNTPRGVRIRKSLEDLGPIFIKFGQLLSTRLDLLPGDIAKELVKLQDNVPPFCGEKAREIIETALKQKVTEAFAEFSTEPLASASIAQVHSAKLKNGKDVVVKVLRPNVELKIAQDVGLLQSIAKIAQKYSPLAQQLRVCEVVEEFRKCIFDELDLMREAANASQLRRNFIDSDLLYIPEINWQLTKKNILVMEKISGIPVADINQLKENNINLKRLAERGVEIFFTQVFRDCFFHADMHPGNIWVCKKNPENPSYLGLDFGIVGTLGPEDQRYLAENFLAFFKRDYRRVAELHVESGWVPRDTRVDEFESAIRSVCEPIFERPLKDISFGKTLLRLFQVARRFNMVIQPQLVLLQKTLISVEGLGRQLYPDLDLWNTAQPFLENWMRSRIGAKAIINKVKKYGPYWLEKMPDIPDLIFQGLDKLKRQDNIDIKLIAESYNKGNGSKNKFYGFFVGIAVSTATATATICLRPDLLSFLQQYYLATLISGCAVGLGAIAAARLVKI